MEPPTEDPSHAFAHGTVRVLLAGATVAAQQLMRLRVRQAQEIALAEAGRARRLAQELESHRQLALAQLQGVDRVWLQFAEPQDIARAWQTAHTWESVDPEHFTGHADRIRDVVADRFGVDLDDPDLPDAADPTDVAARLRQQESVDRSADAPAQHQFGQQQPGKEQTRQERVAEDVDLATAARVTADIPRDLADVETSDRTHQRRAAREEAHDQHAMAAPAAYGSPEHATALRHRATAAGVEPEVADRRARAASAFTAPGRAATTGAGANREKTTAAAVAATPQPSHERLTARSR